jgi:hypothetical protein
MNGVANDDEACPPPVEVAQIQSRLKACLSLLVWGGAAVLISNDVAVGTLSALLSDRLGASGRNQHLQQSGRVPNASRDCYERL